MKNIIVSKNLDELIVTGTVVWSGLSEARGYRDPDTGIESDRKTFSISILVGEDGNHELAEEITRQVDVIEDKMFKDATADLSMAKKKTAKRASPKYGYEEDAAGEATGRLKMSFKRREFLGAPAVLNTDNTEFTGKFIPKGSTVAVRATVRSYKGVKDFGATYQLEQVKILKIVEQSFTPKPLDPSLDKEFGTVNLDDLPL